MIHLYHGDGKGKTTAACGLAVRAAGSGMRVLFTQFFKSGDSSEIGILSSVRNITVIMPEVFYGRFANMNDRQKEEAGKCYTSLLRKVVGNSGEYDLIVLDEAVSVYKYGLFGCGELMDFLCAEGKKREIVLTGRDPAPELKDIADYITEMKKGKHPFDLGIKARKGIEF